MPAGDYAATFVAGAFTERLPQVLVFPGRAPELLTGGQLYPLPPLALQHGWQRSVVSGLQDVQVSPDGKTVLLFQAPSPTVTTGALLEVPVDGGPTVKLSDAAWHQGYRFSPDGQTISWFDEVWVGTAPAPPGAPCTWPRWAEARRAPRLEGTRGPSALLPRRVPGGLLRATPPSTAPGT